MKRKFSLNLAPVKVSTKPDSHSKQAQEPASSHSQAHSQSHSHSHRRHFSKDSVSSANSALINRRPLDPKTELELRSACALILQNFKPSDHDMVNTDPKLDFQGLNRRREHKTVEPSQVNVRKPTGAPAEPKRTHDGKKQVPGSDPTAKSYPDLPMQANTGRRRTDTAQKDLETRKAVKSPSREHRKPTTARPDPDSDDAKSPATPLTGSTDPHPHNASTAPTSAAVTSGRSSKRISRQFDNPAAAADAQAAEWMRQELEKRRVQQIPQPQPRTEPQAPVRPSSRSRSFRSDIKGYIFPGSSTISRAQSSESLRTTKSHASSQEQKRSGSSHGGWRSWGLQRKFSSRNNSRPGTSKGRMESQEPEKKPEVNLNRELPPLPSLDSWKQSEEPKTSPKKENRKSQAHIATVMRPQDKQQREYAAAVRQHHRRSGSDTLALRHANAYPLADPQAARVAAYNKFQVQPVLSPKRADAAADGSMDFDHMISAMSSNKNLDSELQLRPNGQAHHRSTSNLSRSPSAKMSCEGRLEAPPNFSRKISSEVVRGTEQSPEPESAYPNVVQVAPQQKSKLKKVLSGWMLKKDRKDDWMQRIEKEGVKGGVMIQDESAALPPVVRY